MTLDWLHFTPWRSLAGGALIGLSAALLVLANGRIAGISGILGTLVGRSAPGERPWRLAFLIGLLAAPMVWQIGGALPAAHIAASPGVLIAAGLLVGLGTRYASGCTSGHGVCGLSRGSVRSLAATLAFMAAGFATVFLLRRLIG